MRTHRSLVACLCLAAGWLAPSCALADWKIPPQVELRVPFEPTAYPSKGQTFLMYELCLTNYSGKPVDLRRIEVFDSDQPDSKPVAAFDGEQIDPLLQDGPRVVGPGANLVLYMQVVFESNARVPEKLKHRVFTTDDSIEGAVVGTHHTKVKTLVAPVRGADWYASDGPSNDRDNHHRRGLLVFDGRATISRRYAIDWFLTNGQKWPWREGDAHDKSAYFSYGQPVYAVASGTVVKARDGVPDNYPGPVDDYRVAGPLTLETASGNMIVLDLGGGQFAHYYHLQPGSLRVKAGDRVRSGEALARIGVSGDPNVPHLHFEVTTSANPVVGEGIPYILDQFRVKAPDGSWTTVTRELPARKMVVDFGQAAPRN